jgi:hypothetical protein
MNMSNFVRRAAIGAASCLAVSGTALADGHIKTTDATGIYNGTDGTGGAFIVSQDSGDNGLLGGLGLSATTGGEYGRGSFYSFCIERNEDLHFGAQYYTQIAKSAMYGGVSGGSGNPSVDPLSSETAVLYRTFRDGGSYGGTVGTIDSSAETTALQWAIWYSEGELAWGDINAQAQELYTWAHAWALDPDNAGQLCGVRVLRLWDSNANGVFSGAHQDLLTVVPLPPAAYASMATLGAMGLFAVIRRRQIAAC